MCCNDVAFILNKNHKIRDDHMLKRRSALSSVYLLLILLSPFAAQAEGLASAFGKIELIKDVTMSPNGQYLASVFTVDGKPVVMT